jgi:hypothetical protein
MATSDRPHDPARPGISEAYLRLLKGEITSQDFVKAVEKSVGGRRSPKAKRAARRAAASGEA